MRLYLHILISLLKKGGAKIVIAQPDRKFIFRRQKNGRNNIKSKDVVSEKWRLEKL